MHVQISKVTSKRKYTVFQTTANVEWQKVKEYMEKNSKRRFSLKLKENSVGKMHKEVKVLFEPDIKKQKETHFNHALKILLILSDTYIINSRIKQLYLFILPFLGPEL